MIYTFVVPAAYTAFAVAQYSYMLTKVYSGYKVDYKANLIEFNQRFTWDAYKAFARGAILIGAAIDVFNVDSNNRSDSTDTTESMSSPKVEENLGVEVKKCLAEILDNDVFFSEAEISKSFKEIGLYPAIEKECKRLDKVAIEKCQVEFFDLCMNAVKEKLMDTCCTHLDILEEDIQVCAVADCSGLNSSAIQDIDPILSH